MSETLFKKIDYTLSTLLAHIDMGQIGLPDLQRPFVWPNKKVRDLFDSMYRGYPVGYLLFWENGGAGQMKSIGTGQKQLPAQLLVIDGQQRLTSLYAVIKGLAVKRENFKEERIQIAFNPLQQSFEVADAAIRKDPTWISDISAIWSEDTDIFEFVEGYLENLISSREIEADEKRAIQKAINRLANIGSFPFTVLALAADLDEEQVAEVFVRINSKGTPLNQADFILTLMSVFQDELRTDLEDFCRKSRVPTASEASPFNYFIEPDPDHLLRVAIGLGFRRARLQYVYSILRGKDLETGDFSEDRREQQFKILQDAQREALDLGNWHEFMKALIRAGYRSRHSISSKNALLFSYIYYLIGKKDFGIDPYRLRAAIARWFFFVSLTGRYTDSPEARMEQDLADLRGITDGQQFLDLLERTTKTTFTSDYWQFTLPGELATSSARSPGLFAYYASLNLLDARVLFSKMKVAELLDPATRAKKAALERHHLFPKAYLQRTGIQSRRDINQIANYALLEWPDNIEISDRAPSDYYPDFAARYQGDELREASFWHALEEGWHDLPYDQFLERRRRGIAAVIRRGFESLSETADTASAQESEARGAPSVEEIAAQGSFQRTLDRLPEAVRGLMEELHQEPLQSEADLRNSVNEYLEVLEELQFSEEFLDLETARRVAERCDRLLKSVDAATPVEHQQLIQAAVHYFLLDEDAESDITSPIGFDDDEQVVAAVEVVIASEAAECAPGTSRRTQ